MYFLSLFNQILITLSSPSLDVICSYISAEFDNSTPPDSRIISNKLIPFLSFFFSIAFDPQKEYTWPHTFWTMFSDKVRIKSRLCPLSFSNLDCLFLSLSSIRCWHYICAKSLLMNCLRRSINWIQWKLESLFVLRCSLKITTTDMYVENGKNHLRVYLCFVNDWRMTNRLSLRKVICVSIKYAL